MDNIILPTMFSWRKLVRSSDRSFRQDNLRISVQRTIVLCHFKNDSYNIQEKSLMRLLQNDTSAG